MFKKLRKRYHDFILTDWGEIFELFFGLLCAVGIMAFALLCREIYLPEGPLSWKFICTIFFLVYVVYRPFWFHSQKRAKAAAAYRASLVPGTEYPYCIGVHCGDGPAFPVLTRLSDENLFKIAMAAAIAKWKGPGNTVTVEEALNEIPVEISKKHGFIPLRCNYKVQYDN